MNALVAGSGSYIVRPCGHDLHSLTVGSTKFQAFHCSTSGVTSPPPLPEMEISAWNLGLIKIFYNNAHLLSKNIFFLLHPNILLLTYYCILPAVILLYEPLKYIPFSTSC